MQTMSMSFTTDQPTGTHRSVSCEGEDRITPAQEHAVLVAVWDDDVVDGRRRDRLEARTPSVAPGLRDRRAATREVPVGITVLPEVVRIRGIADSEVGGQEDVLVPERPRVHDQVRVRAGVASDHEVIRLSGGVDQLDQRQLRHGAQLLQVRDLEGLDEHLRRGLRKPLRWRISTSGSSSASPISWKWVGCIVPVVPHASPPLTTDEVDDLLQRRDGLPPILFSCRATR